MANLNAEQLRRLARLGAMARLEQIRAEEAAIRSEFPELFGRGGHVERTGAALPFRRLLHDGGGGARQCRRQPAKKSPSGCGSIGPTGARRRVPSRVSPASSAGPVVVLLVTMLVPWAAAAQGLAPSPPGPYVIDVRGTTLGVPQTSVFYPDIPSETVIPARGFGLQAGAHIYPVSIRTSRLGVGVDIFYARATATTPLDATTATDGIPVESPPDVEVTQRIISPQLSLNFGTSRGWSYLSTGVGSGRVTSAAGSASLTTSKLAVNAGGGARWFVTDHLGVGFDLRANWVGSRALFAASAGFSLK